MDKIPERDDMPVDFVKKFRSGDESSGTGYPFQISANDLKTNFDFLLRQIKKLAKRPSGGGSLAGAFFGIYPSADGTQTFLQGGTVTGGNGGSVTIPDYNVTSGSGVLYLRAQIKATIADGVMLPGAELLSANLAVGSSVPANDQLTVTSETGFIYDEIGRWTAGVFAPSQVGNRKAEGCPGNYNLFAQ